jgi:hypothetical protein
MQASVMPGKFNLVLAVTRTYREAFSTAADSEGESLHRLSFIELVVERIRGGSIEH